MLPKYGTNVTCKRGILFKTKTHSCGRRWLIQENIFKIHKALFPSFQRSLECCPHAAAFLIHSYSWQSCIFFRYLQTSRNRFSACQWESENTFSFCHLFPRPVPSPISQLPLKREEERECGVLSVSLFSFSTCKHFSFSPFFHLSLSYLPLMYTCDMFNHTINWLNGGKLVCRSRLRGKRQGGERRKSEKVLAIMIMAMIRERKVGRLCWIGRDTQAMEGWERVVGGEEWSPTQEEGEKCLVQTAFFFRTNGTFSYWVERMSRSTHFMCELLYLIISLGMEWKRKGMREKWKWLQEREI